MSHIKPYFAYGIKDVPIRYSEDVLTDGIACDSGDVTRYVPKRINLGILKWQNSISQKSAPPYRVIIDLSIQNVPKHIVEGSMPIRN